MEEALHSEEESATETENETGEIEEAANTVEEFAEARCEADKSFPKDISISFPLINHTTQSIANLVCMIYTRGALLSRDSGMCQTLNLAEFSPDLLRE